MKSFSAGGIVFNKKGEVLLVVQRGPSISFPKGGINPGEEHEVAARREILEESGVSELKLVSDLGTYVRPNMFVPDEIKEIHMFLFTTDEFDLKPTDPHNPEAMWVSRDEVVGRLSSKIDGEFFEEKILKTEVGLELSGENTRR